MENLVTGGEGEVMSFGLETEPTCFEASEAFCEWGNCTDRVLVENEETKSEFFFDFSFLFDGCSAF